MGIPYYFKILTDRYENIIKLQKDVPVCDRLFLDLNCAIHPCSAKVLSDPTNYDKDTDTFEQTIIECVVDYIDKIVQFTKPTTLLYIAIDGLPPRAKDDSTT